MDEFNLSRLNDLKPKNCRAKVELLGKYHPNGKIIIEDPYLVRIIIVISIII